MNEKKEKKCKIRDHRLNHSNISFQLIEQQYPLKLSKKKKKTILYKKNKLKKKYKLNNLFW